MVEALLSLLEKLGLTRQQWAWLIGGGFVMATAVHVAWVCGWLATFGIAAPYVKADELNKLTQTLQQQQVTAQQQQQQTATAIQSIADETKQLRVEQLERDLLSAMQQKCHANNAQMRLLYADRVQDIIIRYERLMHAEPRIPTCDQV